MGDFGRSCWFFLFHPSPPHPSSSSTVFLPDPNPTTLQAEKLQHDSLPTEKVWGAAYHIPALKVPEVRAYLDIREINGYSIQYTPFHPASNQPNTTKSHPEPIKCLVYIGLPSNPQFLGPQDPQELAAHILKSRGPSGENKEYLYMLETALLDLSAESEDRHISDLASRCRKLEVSESKGPGKSEVLGQPEVESSLHKVGSTEEQEEVER